MVGMAFRWFSHSMNLMETVEREAALLHWPRLIQRDLLSIREILYPPVQTNDETVKPAHQLIVRDREGDVSVYFLSREGILVQYSRGRGKFRDLLRGVNSFRVVRTEAGLAQYTVSMKSKDLVFDLPGEARVTDGL